MLSHEPFAAAAFAAAHLVLLRLGHLLFDLLDLCCCGSHAGRVYRVCVLSRDKRFVLDLVRACFAVAFFLVWRAGLVLNRQSRLGEDSQNVRPPFALASPSPRSDGPELRALQNSQSADGLLHSTTA